MRLIVFDLDGTLIDSRADLASSVNAMLAEIGRPPLAEATVTDMVGEGARVLVGRALRAAGVDPAACPDALQRFLALYGGRLLDHTRPYEGVPEMLAALHEGAPLAVLTNKPASPTLRILAGLGLDRFFAAVIGGDAPYPRKPDPGALLHLMDRFQAAPDETLLVGDSRIDLQTARNAGARVCLAAYGYGFRFDPAELVGLQVAASPRDIIACSAATSSEASRERGAPPR